MLDAYRLTIAEISFFLFNLWDPAFEKCKSVVSFEDSISSSTISHFANTFVYMTLGVFKVDTLGIWPSGTASESAKQGAAADRH